MKFTSLFALILILPLCACASKTLPLDNSLKGKKYTLSGHTQAFQEETLGSSLTGSAIAALGASYHNYTPVPRSWTAADDKQNLVQKYDPTDIIRENVAKDLSSKLDWKKVEQTPDLFVMLNGNWGIDHHPIIVTNYAIYYSAQLTITENVREKERNVLFSCGHRSPDYHSYEEIYSNNAALIKQHMDASVKICSDKLKMQISERILKDTADKK